MGRKWIDGNSRKVSTTLYIKPDATELWDWAKSQDPSLSNFVDSLLRKAKTEADELEALSEDLS